MYVCNITYVHRLRLAGGLGSQDVRPNGHRLSLREAICVDVNASLEGRRRDDRRGTEALNPRPAPNPKAGKLKTPPWRGGGERIDD